MTRRLPHFLRPSKGDTIPKRLVVVDVDTVSEPVEGRPGVERERMVRWAGAGWDTSSRGVRRAWEGGGETPLSWWEATLWALRHGGNTWVVSHGASRVWGVLGVWGLIESRELSLTGEDKRENTRDGQPCGVRPMQRHPLEDEHATRQTAMGVVPDVRQPGTGPCAAGTNGNRRSRAGRGYAVLEDPPSVLCAKARGYTGQLTLVDSRNWGLDSPPVGLTCCERARWLANAMERVCQLLTRETLGSLQTTAGSQAMYSFRRRHLTHTMGVHTNAEALELEREAYYGGRCECRRIGVLPSLVYHLDFRSLYGSICAGAVLPALLLHAGTGRPDDVSQVRDGDVLRIADVSLDTDEPAYPFRRDGLVIYPTGRFRTVLCGPELDDAVAHGRVRNWHRWACYVGTPCLASYAGHLLSLLGTAREAGDAPLCQFLKRLLVSLPGKFGQTDWRWEGTTKLRPPGPWSAWGQSQGDGTILRCRSLGWQCQIEERGGWAPNAIPSIAAWVCSAGRVKLLEAIRCAGWRHVAYHDTDSLLVSARGMVRLRDAGMVGSGEAGRLREMGRHWHCEIRGLKHYTLDGVLKCAGAPRGTVESGPDDTHYWFRQWLKSAVRSGVRPEAERALRVWQRVGAYRHGRVLSDGRVEPWVVGL